MRKNTASTGHKKGGQKMRAKASQRLEQKMFGLMKIDALLHRAGIASNLSDIKS